MLRESIFVFLSYPFHGSDEDKIWACDLSDHFGISELEFLAEIQYKENANKDNKNLSKEHFSRYMMLRGCLIIITYTIKVGPPKVAGNYIRNRQSH